MVLRSKIYASGYITFIFIISHENVVVDKTVISLSCILSEIKKSSFLIIVLANLHISNIDLHITTF